MNQKKTCKGFVLDALDNLKYFLSHIRYGVIILMFMSFFTSCEKDIQEANVSPNSEVQKKNDVDVLKKLFETKAVNPTYYEIVNKKANKCLDVDSGNVFRDGTRYQIWDCTKGDNQQFALIPLGNSYFKLINKASQKVADLDNGNSKNGTKIQQWSYTNADWQQWKLLDNGLLVNKKTGKAFDLENGSTYNGTKIHEWDSYPNLDSQKWTIRLIPQNESPKIGLDDQKSKSGKTTISGWSTDDKGINRVEIRINGILLDTLQPNSYRRDLKNNSGWSTTLYTEKYTNGNYTISATAFDNEGVASTVSSIWGIYNNEAPKIAMDDSNNGKTVRGIFTQKGWATDDTHVNRVEIYANGKYIGNANYGNYRGDLKTNNGFFIDINTKYYANDFLEIKAVAFDDNNASRTLTRSVIVKNTPRDIDVIYINGIRTDSGMTTSGESTYLNDSLLDPNEFKDLWRFNTGFVGDMNLIKNNLISKLDNRQNVYLSGVYNPTSKIPWIGDMVESAKQKTGFTWVSYKSIFGGKTDIQKIVDGIKLGVENAIIINDRVALLLPHSQGNFFGNEAIRQLLNGDFVTNNTTLTPEIVKNKLTKDTIANSVAILGLGSPNRTFTSKVSETYYIGNTRDGVVFIGSNPLQLYKDYTSQLYNPKEIFSDNSDYSYPLEIVGKYHFLDNGYINNPKTGDLVKRTMNSIISTMRNK